MAVRRLRGSDFMMRWSQGLWSERRMVEAVNDHGEFFCIPYGPSGVAPVDPAEYEQYFTKLEATGLGAVKRPDLLIFSGDAKGHVTAIVEQIGGLETLPFTLDDDSNLQELLSLAVIAVEAENSLWKAEKMPCWGQPLRPMKRMNGLPGLPKNAIVPTIIVKDEDKVPLEQWQASHGIPIHVWHAFYDRAFGIALDRINFLISSGQVSPEAYNYPASGGGTSTKTIFKTYYQHAYGLGTMVEQPQLLADSITSPNGQIFPYVRFDGGVMKLSSDAVEELRMASKIS